MSSFTDTLLKSLAETVVPETLQFLLTLLILGVFLLGMIVVVSGFFAQQQAQARSFRRMKGQLWARSLNDEWHERKRSLESLFLSKREWKEREKADRDEEKRRDQDGLAARSRVWVLEFEGDLEATAVEKLRHEITAVLEVATADRDQIVLRLNSPGGTVTGYGHAAAQLERVRRAGLRLTATVDEIAASGGYMMASVADRIVAAPFAILGSIGVIAELPNLNRLLKRADVDWYQFTAGEAKRPLSVFGEVKPEGIAIFRAQIESTHKLFQDHVRRYRPQLDLAKVATGEIWHARQAQELGLIDEIKTSDELLTELRRGGPSLPGAEVFALEWRPHLSWKERFGPMLSRGLIRLLRSAWQRGMLSQPALLKAPEKF
ncbi:MAG TPA: protease SohB [Pseudobdellovibrionaceae bacterium]|nr:protease SohB [Pseudobdellovibrionaceae bacterium]